MGPEVAVPTLLGALALSLRHCPSAVSETAAYLETVAPGWYDDLEDKLAVLARPDLDESERIYSLWLFYVSVFRPDTGGMAWLGPDMAGPDDEECLRLMGWSGEAEGLARELALLAPGHRVEASSNASGGARFALRPGVQAGS